MTYTRRLQVFHATSANKLLKLCQQQLRSAANCILSSAAARMLAAQESWSSATLARHCQASVQRFTFTAGAAAPPGSAQQLPGSVDEDAGGAGVVEWRLRGQAMPILSAPRSLQALRHVQCRRCGASLQHSAANVGAAQLRCRAPLSQKALCCLLAALQFPGSVDEDAGGAGVVEWRCEASVQRSTFSSGTAAPPCSAPHS